MNPERWHQIDALLQSALELPLERRSAFLTQACESDEELLSEVLSLLDHHGRAGNSLEAIPGEVAAEMLEQAPNRLIPEQRVGHYQIVSLLGAGGMGEVYLARDNTLGRPVALKLLPIRFTQDPFRVSRFEQEARTASGLNHPNIVTIHQIGEIDGTHFIVTELIEGRTLRHRLLDGPMTVMEALDIAIQLASALNSAHTAGIVHRDIKPENIMLRPDGLVKVLDFGLAKLAEQEEHAGNVDAPIQSTIKTGVGLVMGSAQYMSPEQARGQKTDARTDTFSFGVVLYEMLTTHAPFTGATVAEILEAILNQDPPPFAQYTLTIPPELERITRKAFSREVRDRYSTTLELYRDLKQLDQQLKLQEKVGEFLPALMNRRRAIWVGGTAIVATAVPALVAWKLWPQEAQVQTLAVLPFASPGNDPVAQNISDFISGALIDDLKPVPSLKVKDGSAISGLTRETADLSRTAEQLGVSFLLTGRVIAMDESVSIDATLVDAAKGRTLWQRTYPSVALGDASRLHENIASDVVDIDLFKSLSNFERKQFATLAAVDRDAWDFYRRGRRQFLLDNELGDGKACDLWQQAVDHDHKFALAHCALGVAYCVMAVEGYEHPDEASHSLKVCVENATRLDPAMAAVQCLLGTQAFFFDWDWKKARDQFEFLTRPASQAVDPILFKAYVAMCRALGDNSQALDLTSLGNSIDPNPYFKVQAANLLVSMRKFNDAVVLYKEMIRDYPSDLRAYSGMEEAFRIQGNFREAISARRSAVDVAGPYSVPDSLRGLIDKAEGEEGYRKIIRKSAELSLQYLENREAHADYVPRLDFARSYAQLGDKDNAIRQLKEAFDERSPALVFLNSDPVWDSMRNDVRFRGFVRQLGLPSH